MHVYLNSVPQENLSHFAQVKSNKRDIVVLCIFENSNIRRNICSICEAEIRFQNYPGELSDCGCNKIV